MKPDSRPLEAPLSRALLIFLWAITIGMEGVTAASPSAPQVDDIGFCKPYTWLSGGWVAPPRLLAVGDINGDGYDDFIYASPQDKILDVSLNGRGWKPVRGERLVSGLPQTIVGICLGHFGGKGIGLDVAVIGDKGRLVETLNDGSGQFSEPKSVAETAGARATPAEIRGAATSEWVVAVHPDPAKIEDDIAVVTRDGRVRVYDGVSGVLASQFRIAAPVKAVAAAVSRDLSCELADLSGRTVSLYRVGEKLIPKREKSAPTGETPERIAEIRAPRGQEALALGDVNADGKADVLVNGRVFLAPDFRRSVSVPGWETFTRPVTALLANVVGRGRADMVVQHEGPDYFGSTEADCDVYVTYFRSDADWDADGLTNEEEARLHTDPLDRDTDNDGLLDGWEVHGFAGIDFPGMGASPLRKDVFVMNLPNDTVPIDAMEKQMREKIVPFFADLPYTNLDGKTGFALHWMTQSPALPIKGNEGKSWGQIAGETFPPEKIGFYHWMLVGGLGGGGQSSQLADAGSTGMGSWIHEFGHQLGLSHSGKWDAWSPTYTSLMNYSYSYGFEGDPKKVHFSTGELASLVLNESHLPGKVPFPMEKLEFLAGPPYHLHLKPAGKDATYVDWGWTGVFSDKTVRANITFGYGVSGGERLQPSGTLPMNYNGPYELMTDYQASLAEHRDKLYMVTASRAPLDPKAPRPESATLVLQTYLGHHAWTKPATIASKVTNDPCAASDGRTFYVFYPTPDGVMYRAGQPDKLGEAQLIPDSQGAYASAVNWKGTLNLFLYRGPDQSITYRTVRGKSLGPVIDLGIKSTIPPGAAVDTLHSQLLVGTAEPVDKQPYRWQLRRFAWDKAAGGFKQLSTAFVGGEKSGWAGNRRPTLIFNPSREFGPDGRVYWIAAGLARPSSSPTAFFLAQTIGYKKINDGWLLWRYYDEWTNTRSGIGAAWFDHDLVIATTWASGTAGGDGGVFCAYNGTAISNVDMGDFDDVSLMANYGMARSIGTFARMPPEDAGK